MVTTYMLENTFLDSFSTKIPLEDISEARVVPLLHFAYLLAIIFLFCILNKSQGICILPKINLF